MKNFTSCFKEKKFLKFFFNQMRLNNTDRYLEFPYLSLCGKERNFIRCDDYPFVYTHIIKKSTNDGNVGNQFAHNHVEDLLTVPFQPEKIFMLPKTGRVYHPAPERVGSIGLVRSKLAIEISKYFTFEHGENEPPTLFNWEGTEYKLDCEWFSNVIKQKLEMKV